MQRLTDATNRAEREKKKEMVGRNKKEEEKRQTNSCVFEEVNCGL